MAHLWVCMPFLVAWVTIPSFHKGIEDHDFARIQAFIGVVVVYLIARTWFAVKASKPVNWEYLYPPIDVAIVSMLIWLGNRDPLSNVALLYLFPLAQAAGTLNVRWSIAVAAMVLVGTLLATHGLRSDEPFNSIFRYFFLFVLASLFTMLSQVTARLLGQLDVARDRNRMALEMHDGVQSHLMTLTKQIELAEHLAVPTSRQRDILAEGRETTRLAADELRYLVQRMRAASLDAGFVPAIQGFVHNLLTRHEIGYSFAVDGIGVLNLPVQHAAFRVCQEALTNVIKHSGASEVKVQLTFGGGNLTMDITDNGRGFEPNWESEGLAGLRTRAAEVGGELTVKSGSAGTNVQAIFPLEGRVG